MKSPTRLIATAILSMLIAAPATAHIPKHCQSDALTLVIELEVERRARVALNKTASDKEDLVRKLSAHWKASDDVAVTAERFLLCAEDRSEDQCTTGGEMTEPSDKRPESVPDDYGPIYITANDGTRILVWGRVVETVLPDGTKKLVIEGIVPEE